MKRTEKTKILTQDFLYNEIVINNKTKKQISEETGLSLTTIVKYMKEYDIPFYKDYHFRFNEEEMQEIIDLYLNKKISANKIGKMYGTTHKIIISSLQKYGIKTRNIRESEFVLNGKELDERLLNKEWLYEQYWNKRLSMGDIATILGYDDSTIQDQLRRFNIPIRTAAESKTGVYYAIFSSLYVLLRSFFRRSQIPEILERDKYTCQICEKKDVKLNVHHIIYFSDIIKEIISENPQYDLSNIDNKLELYKIIVNDERFLNKDNLITLCEECHKEVHKQDKIISSQASLNNEEGSTTISKESTL